jgi:hypothetical protein
VRAGRVARPELARARCRPAALGVVAVGVAAGADGKNGGLASGEVRLGDVEDEADMRGLKLSLI